MKKVNGFTLLELLMSLMLLSIVTAIALPSFTNMLVTTRVNNEITSLQKLLILARHHAIANNNTVTLCPLNGLNACENSWQNTISVFIDHNNNRIYDADLNETIIAIKPEITKGDKLQYGKTRIGLTYAATGQLSGWGQNGTFSYCPKDHPNSNRGITVALTGRSYLSVLNKKNNLHVNRSGKKISCY